MLTVASIDPTITVLPNCIIDMVTLAQQIRRSKDDTAMKNAKPCLYRLTSKATRENIHDLALALNSVKSQVFDF